MKLFLVLGNQLFNPIYLRNYKDHQIYMAEDYGLCTYEKHHKQKILLFLSAMRSYADELKINKFKVNYLTLKDDFEKDYFKKLELFIKKIQSKSFLFSKLKINFLRKSYMPSLNQKKLSSTSYNHLCFFAQERILNNI